MALTKVTFPINWDTLTGFLAAYNEQKAAKGVKFGKYTKLKKENDRVYSAASNAITFFPEHMQFDFVSRTPGEKLIHFYYQELFTESPKLCFYIKTIDPKTHIWMLNDQVLFKNDAMSYNGEIYDYVESERQVEVEAYKGFCNAKRIIDLYRRYKANINNRFMKSKNASFIDDLEYIRSYIKSSYMSNTKKDFQTFMALTVPDWERKLGLASFLSYRKDELFAAVDYATNYIINPKNY